MDNEIQIKKILDDDIKRANDFFDFIDKGAREDLQLYEDIKKEIKSIDEVRALRKSLIIKRKITYKEFKKNNIKKYINRLIGFRGEFFILKGIIRDISFVNEFVDYNNIEDLKGEIYDYIIRYDNKLFISNLKFDSLFSPKTHDPDSVFEYPKPYKDLLEDYKRQGLKKLKKKDSTKKITKTILIYFLGAVFYICSLIYGMENNEISGYFFDGFYILMGFLGFVFVANLGISISFLILKTFRKNLVYKDYIVNTNFSISILLSILLLFSMVKRIQLISEMNHNDVDFTKEIRSWDYKSEINKRNSKERKKVGDVDIEFLSDKNLYENYLYHYSVLFPEDSKVTYGLGKKGTVMGIGDSDGLTINVQVTENPWLGVNKFRSDINFKSNNNQIKTNNDFIEFILRNEKAINDYRNDYQKTLNERDLGLENLRLTNIEPVKYKNRKFLKIEHTGILSSPDYKLPIIRDVYFTYYRENQYTIIFDYLDTESNKNLKPKMDLFLMSFIVDEVNL